MVEVMNIKAENSVTVLTARLVDNCCNCLNIISSLNNESFCKSYNTNSSVGAHLRHIYERMECVMLGLDGEVIDYDARKRDVQIETNIDVALAKFKEVQSFFQDLKQNKNLVIEETVSLDGKKISFESNIAREILHLIDHTTHHLAIVKILLEKLGIKVHTSFGKAVSTIIYERESEVA